jgi:hypothetical protein
MAPIRGHRYKCSKCEDFDFCAACEAKGGHAADHIFVKHKRPLKPESKANTSTDWRAPKEKKDDKKPADKPAEKKDTDKKKGTPCRRPAAGPKCQFVADLSLPDGSVVAAGSVVTKSWSVKNVGTAQWPEGVHLMCVGGQLVPATEEKKPFASVPLAMPGMTVEVSARVAVPKEAGRYTGYYRLATADGKRFGHRVWLDVLVPKETAAPIAAPAPTPATPPVATAKPAEVKKPATPSPKKEVKAPTAAAPTAPKKEEKYGAELSRLRGMGFKDDEMLLELLAAANGNVQQVIDWLVNPVV